MRSLGIDFGERRIGLAVTDPEGRFAMPLTTVERVSDRQAVGLIAEIAKRQEIDRLVVGEPVNVDGSRGPAALRAKKFAERLGKATGLPFRLVCETLTTVEARERLLAAGVDLKKHPETLDSTSAQIMLEEALSDGPPAELEPER